MNDICVEAKLNPRGIDYRCFLRANAVRPYTGFLVLQEF